MELLILFLPLLGASLMGLLIGRATGVKGTIFIALSVIFSTLIIALIVFVDSLKDSSPKYLKFFSWIKSGSFYIEWEFLFDSLALLMIVTVLIVSSLVHLYSINYMANDPHLIRFLAYLTLFTFFMLVLVTASNFFQFFIGWEGVGICSYLLVNFWFTRISANKAALKALMVNRLGDFSLIMAMALIFILCRSLTFDLVFSCLPFMCEIKVLFFSFEIKLIELLVFFLFLGAVGKSAQIGLHTWLPDAMEGPTPVSALIHAATMVTAGVFLMIRCSYIFELAPRVLMIIVFVGALTAFFAATAGLVQHDIKKIIAYSTCSQLGYMVFIAGLSYYDVSLFHLINHAFFKALLFLGAGSVIHAFLDEQDIRKMGASLNFLPVTYSTLVVGSLALMGFPFLSGFYSKETILEISGMSPSFLSTFSFWLGALGALFTAYYSFRLIYYVFLSPMEGFKSTTLRIEESSSILLLPLIILSFFSIFSGYFLKDLVIGFGNNYFFGSLSSFPKEYSLEEYEHLAFSLKIIPLIFSLFGASLALVFNHCLDFELFFLKFHPKNYGYYSFFAHKWHFDQIYNQLIAAPLFRSGYSLVFVSLDKGLLELLGPFGLSFFVHQMSRLVSSVHRGDIFVYLRYILLAFLFFFFYENFYIYL